MSAIDINPSLRDYFGQDTDLPREVWACLNRQDGTLDLTVSEYFDQGSNLPPEVWEWLNRDGAFSRPPLGKFVAPFPPKHLMENVSGLISERDFASHGADFWVALSQLAPQPLAQFQRVLDFGCGCGRLGRMFKGHRGELYGCDIDGQHVEWLQQNIPYYTADLTKPDAVLPYKDRKFDLIISISIFTHLAESSQDLLLSELHRVAQDDALVMLSIHGERAMERAISEPKIWNMICVDKEPFDEAKAKFDSGAYGFILQQGHLTTPDFHYGISFAPRSYVACHWGKWFQIENYAAGALHDWQDVIVMRPKRI